MWLLSARRMKCAFLTIVLMTGGLAVGAVGVQAQRFGPPPPVNQEMKYRFIGPDGNRAVAAIGEPGNPNVMMVGAASGGIWRTEDAGLSWQSVFDKYEVQSIGALAMAPSAHNIVWAGTGETFLMRPAHAIGNGIYRSDDMGRTWKRMGLEKTGRIGRVLIHPRNPDVVYACALGNAFNQHPERGIFRTKDGGKTWDKVLFVNDSTGCSDLTMDPVNPNKIIAGMWQVDIKTWGLTSGGKGGGVYVTTDGGDTWKKIAGHGLPSAERIVGKTAVAFAPSDNRRVYALQEDTTATLYRSDDGGDSWRIVNQSHVMAERASYYTRFAVSPDDPNRLYFASVSWSVSSDGGSSFDSAATAPSGDNHDIWIDPGNSKWIMVAHDGGASVSFDKGVKYRRIVLPIAQMYHVWVDNDVPYHVYGNRQDGGSYRGPGISLTGGGIELSEWQSVGGCESGFGIPDPQDSNIIWSGCYDGQLDRVDLRTGLARSVHVWPEATYGWKPADVKHRWHWTFPIAISPFDHNTVYVGSQYVNVTNDGGQSFRIMSPDLTTNDKSHQQNSGILTIDNLMTFDGSVLFAIAESPKERGVIWTGSNDGQVNLTRDAGKTWTNVTPNIKGVPAWGTISNVEPSRYDGGTAYISVDLHQVGIFDPYIYKTADYGKSWTMIAGGIPKTGMSYVHVVREDPKRRGMLYAGTDNALYVSKDDGASWQSLQYNLPPAPVYWMMVQERFDDLVVGTYGRGFWILDDLGPVREMTPEAAASDVHLFKPRDAYRFRTTVGFRDPGSFVGGENPPPGASINFQLKKAADTVEMRITTADGQPVRTLTFPGRAGINRVWWNLRYDSARAVVLRTPPPNAAWVPVGINGTRPMVLWSRSQANPLVVPGTYTVTLKAAGKEQTQALTVLADPAAGSTAEGMKAQLTFALQLREDITSVADAINNMEWTRRQLIDFRTMITTDPQYATMRSGADGGAPPAKVLVDAINAAEKQVIATQDKLEDIDLTGYTEDSFRSPMGIYGKLNNLAGHVIESGADMRPTNQQVEVRQELIKQLEGVKKEMDELKAKTIPALNGTLKANGFNGQVKP